MIKLMKSTLYNELETKKKLCNFIMKGYRLSMGEKCLEFEKEFSRYQGRKYSVFYNSGSSANLALIQSLTNLGLIKKNDNIGFSALTWATNVMPLLQLNLKATPIDVSLENLNVCSGNLLNVLRKTNLKVLFITNLLGFCGDLDKIAKICKERGIILLEDNCESLGSELNNIKLGNYSLASTFSFYVGHHLSTIEGGMVCTDDKELYEMLLMVRAHGWSRDLSPEKQNKLKSDNYIIDFYDIYTFYVPGYNFRPTEINGFLGIEQLKHINFINKVRNQNYLEFDKIVQSNNNFQKLNLGHMTFVSNFAYPLICKDKDTFEKYKNRFKENKIETRPIVGGSIIEQPFFKNYLKDSNLNVECPKAKRIHELGFYFPNNPELTKKEIKTICNVLKKD